MNSTSSVSTRPTGSTGDTVLIRLMVGEEDIPAVLQLSREASAQSRYAGAPFREDRLTAFFLDALKHPKTNGIMLAERNGKVIGCLFANASRLLFADAVSAQALFFYVRTDARASRAAIQLLKAYEIWARNRKSIDVNIHVTTGAESGPAIARLLERKGYRSAGKNMYCNAR